LAYELTADSEVRRLGPPVVRERLQDIEFDTGDPVLDAFLERARTKYRQPDLGLRLEALKELWDAWERLKSSRPRRTPQEAEYRAAPRTSRTWVARVPSGDRS
jgi:hypothetical protein